MDPNYFSSNENRFYVIKSIGQILKSIFFSTWLSWSNNVWFFACQVYWNIDSWLVVFCNCFLVSLRACRSYCDADRRIMRAMWSHHLRIKFSQNFSLTLRLSGVCPYAHVAQTAFNIFKCVFLQIILQVICDILKKFLLQKIDHKQILNKKTYCFLESEFNINYIGP